MRARDREGMHVMQRDLKIALEDGAMLPQPPLYSLSTLELATLREFIDEHLNMGYIRPTRSSHGAPILFVKKKSGELRLCVDFRALNKITKKDRYPLPLITDLLDAPRKARIYTKIDLWHAFHLVRVAEGGKPHSEPVTARLSGKSCHLA
jgi:hypothetical protein